MDLNRERRRKKRIRNLISVAYCSIQLLAVVLAFRGLGWLLERSGEEEQVEAMFSVLESKVAEVKTKFTATKAKENTAFSFGSKTE